MKHIGTLLKQYAFPLLLTIIVGVLCAANYTPNTWLSGWDTLQPEFNFSLVFSRMIQGVWRSDQGLGAVAIQSHMADFPHAAFLWILHFIAPVQTLRYLFFFSMLWVGPIGIYVLLKKIKVRPAAAFIGGLSYLCNLGTLQHFIVPLEMFAVLYGLFPWLLLTTINALQKPTKQTLVLFAVLSFAASPMAQTATLYYAYAGIMVVFIISYLTHLHLSFLKKIQRFFVVICILLGTNAYWLLPNIYAAITHGQEIRDARVNQLFSPEAFAKNQAFGTIQNAVMLKNFLFDWNIYNPKTEQFEDLMLVWKPHINHIAVQAILYGLFGMSLLGVVYAIKKKSPLGIALLPLWIISFGMLLSGTPPLPTLFEKITTQFPIASEALRFPFTKFSILYMVPFALFVGYGFEAILKLTTQSFFHAIITIELSLAILVTMLPAFTGNLIHPRMRIHIPKEYFEMFSWFSKQDQTKRVAILPNHTFWNWVYYRWGYQGAGFLQFGIPQPILDRDYDRWNLFNEQYQRELSYAIYSKQPDVITSVLEKYNVGYVLLDTSIIAPGENKNVTLAWQLPELLDDAHLEQVTTFGDTITIYKTAETENKQVTKLPSTLPLPIGEPYDAVYAMNGSYQSTYSDISVSKEARNARTTRVDNAVPFITETFQTEIGPDNPLLYIPLSLLDHSYAYNINIYSKHTNGFPPQLCILNDLTKRCEVFTRLNNSSEGVEDQFLLPPLFDYGTGYSILLQSDQVGNTIGRQMLYAINVSYALWPMNRYVNTNSSPVITNNASYEENWKAYTATTWYARLFPSIFGTPLSKHVLVNSWENGWEIQQENPEQVVFVFFPQYLEWIGIFVGLLVCLCLFLF